MIIGSMPALAPLIGGILTSYTSWHGIFIFLTALAVMMFILTVQLKLPPEALTKRDTHNQSHIIMNFQYMNT